MFSYIKKGLHWTEFRRTQVLSLHMCITAKSIKYSGTNTASVISEGMFFMEMDLKHISVDSVISSIHISKVSRRKEVNLPNLLGDLPI